MAEQDTLDFLDSDLEQAPLLYRWLQKIPYLKNIPFLINLALRLPDPRSRQGMMIYGGSAAGILLIGIVLLVIALLPEKEPEIVKPVADPSTVLAGLATKRKQEVEVRDIHFDRGDDFLNRGEYSRAMLEYELAISKNAALAYYNLGVVYNRLGQQDEAIESYRQAMNARPEFPDAYIGMGMTMKSLGRHTESLQYFLDAIRLSPRDSTYHNNAANAYLQLQNYRKASEHYDRALALDPANIEALINRSSLMLATGDVDGAINGYQEVLRIDPANHAVKNNLGMALRKKGRLYDALSTFREASMMQKTPNVFINMGDTFRDLGQVDDAINSYVSAANLSETNYPLKKLSEYHFTLLRFDDLHDTLNLIARKEPWYPRGEELSSYVAAIRGDTVDAIQRAEALVRRDGDELSGLRSASLLNLLQNRPQNADRYIRQFAQRYPTNPLANALQGELHRVRGDAAKAREVLQPQNTPAAHYYLGKLALAANQKDSADHHFALAANADGEIPGKALFARALIGFSQQNAEAATAHLRDALTKGIGTGQLEILPRFHLSDRYEYRLTYIFSPFNSPAERYLEYARPLLMETVRSRSLEQSALASYESSLYRIAHRQMQRAARYSDAATLNNRAVEMHMTGDLVGSLPLFEQAREHERNDPIIRYNIALTHQKLGNDKEARQLYGELRSAAPLLFEVDINLAVLDERRGNRDAILLGMANLYDRIVSVYQQQAGTAEDLATFDVKIQDPRLALLAALAHSMGGEENRIKARSLFQELRTQHPHIIEGALFDEIFWGNAAPFPKELAVSPRYQMLQGDRALLAGNPQEALKFYQQSYQQNRNVISRAKLGIAYEQMKKPEMANRYFREGGRDGYTIVSLNNLGNNLANLERYDAMQAAYEQALEQEQENFAVLMNYAYANQQFKRYEFAREIFEFAARINPTNPMTYYNLAKIHLMYDRVFMAKEELFKGLDPYPNMPQLNYLMGLLGLLDRNYQESVYYLQRGLNNGVDAKKLDDVELTLSVR
ncbi:tetratricopeptide repeat protein [Chrysiogenes arsenatis]|uniref:tetratricopeptide repeat protein n=1 Tax=Chrysiogenes arsenatis TaxID=309797 RepID=UPI00041A758F|nr:tetratricopeptide repeat protein [Chrysiogenes arsenatis]